jgi:hypothetical protein
MVCDEPCFTVIYNCMNIQYDAEALLERLAEDQAKVLISPRACLPAAPVLLSSQLDVKNFYANSHSYTSFIADYGHLRRKLLST